MSYCVVLVTAPKKGNEAKKLARLVLKEKLAACVNIIKGVDSLFWWEGKIDRAEEFLLIAKTARVRLDELTATVKEIHGYEVPEIVALPLIGGSGEYLDWLRGEVSR